jgi:hypothetical protein
MAKTTTRKKLSGRKSKASKGSKALTSTPKASTLSGRLRAVAGPATFREVGQMTGTHPENARRYLQGGSVGLKFFKNFCNAYNVSADWLLEGTGSQNRAGKSRR